MTSRTLPAWARLALAIALAPIAFTVGPAVDLALAWRHDRTEACDG